MKFIIAFTVLIAGISALPQIRDIDYAVPSEDNERLVTGQIVDAINAVSQRIKDLGLDPFIVKREARSFALPVPVILNAAAVVEDLLSYGLSDIKINNINLGILTMRLTFDLELPHIHISVGDAYGELTIFGKKLAGEISGSVDINRIRAAGRVQIRIGIITGISISDLTINLTLDSVDSDLKIGFQNYDLSGLVNNFLGNTIPDTLLAFRPEVDELLEIILLEIISGIL